MKAFEKKQARELRKQGLSINEIYKKLKVGKGSVSLWVHDIELTKKQKERLSKKGHSFEVIEKRRKTRLANEKARRQVFIEAGVQDIKRVSKTSLFHIGVALYWAEGAKRNRGVLQFSNSDPKMVEIMMKFFNEVCNVPDEKFRGHIHLHPHLDSKKAESYWSKVSGIPKKQFYKTSQQHNIASKNKKDTLPYGTFAIYVCDTKKYLRMMGWIKGMHEQIIKK